MLLLSYDDDEDGEDDDGEDEDGEDDDEPGVELVVNKGVAGVVSLLIRVIKKIKTKKIVFYLHVELLTVPYKFCDWCVQCQHNLWQIYQL